ncbi:MAG: ABC transporter substrate-binding protein [Chlamydiia bacterium]|nr:ABC transporter substrate-binding protein [Chlamydiia bacterium]
MLQRLQSPYIALLAVFSLFLYALSITTSIPKERTPFRLAINPWPGYEPLYLAQELGIFDSLALDVDIVEMSSLADIRRAFERGRIDAMCCSLVEAVDAIESGEIDGRIAMVTDFSDGGDALLARADIASMQELKGKKVAVEPTALGRYILHRALEIHGIRPSDILAVPMEAVSMHDALARGEVDAILTYPPFLDTTKGRLLFSSTELPGEIADVLIVSNKALADPNLQTRLHAAWRGALLHMTETPEVSAELMARREGMSPSEFQNSLSTLRFVTADEQQPVLRGATLANTIRSVQSLILPRDARGMPPEAFIYTTPER